MWLWIFGVLVILAVWTTWLLFPPPELGGEDPFPTWIPVSVTLVVLAVLVGLWAIRRIRAARAARALEKAIAQQAQEQALAAKPEDREEIQALHKQFNEGIASLKRSKLGGGRTGDQALYELPWYAIVGPPGGGKTTALRHSGLQFPFLDPSGGGVRGVGGTRNCDWWFTNEAILLDTAGRYTTESDDRDEWIAFLEQLVKYREEKPLNGVLVAVPVNELLDASEDGVQQMASKIRARIDEMQSTLKMTLPVYVLFTKTDLVSGFVEYFGDLKKSDRGQPWGATFRIDEPKTEPGALFEREFDVLVERLHTRVIKRLSGERNRSVKEKVYSFPLEFAATKRNLADFMAATFAPSGSGATPLLRGFYFTSGTQEGKPLDRVVGAMGRAFGLKGSINEEETGSKEARSYFLRDVFLQIVFPDQNLADLSEIEVRRRRFQKLAIAAAALLVGLLLAVPAVFSYLNNRELVAETDRISLAAAQIDWKGGGDTVAKVQRLDEMRNHLEKLKTWKDDGPPVSYTWTLYQGDKLFEPLKKQYIAALDAGFVKPVREKLEDKLRNVTGDPYLADYNALKSYLLLGENERNRLADPEIERYEVGQLTQVWGEQLLSQSSLAEADLKARLAPHTEFYTRLLRDNDTGAVQLDLPLVESARERLRGANPIKAYYELFVIALIDEKIDNTADASFDNLKYPPVTVAQVFEDRPEALTIVGSKRRALEGKYQEVRGPFTAEGFKAVDQRLKDGASLLEREAWVVPYTAQEKTQQDNINKALARVRERYEDEYISEWRQFFRDLDVNMPQNNRESIDEFRILATPDWPYERLLQTLADNTQFEDPNKQKLGSLAADGGVIDQIQSRVRRRIESKAGVRLDELQQGKGVSSQERIARSFQSMVRFGIPQAYVPPPPTSDGTALPPKLPPDPELGKYVAHLEQLSSEMTIVEEGPPNTDTKSATELFEKAVKDSEQMLLKMDKLGQELMEPLLMNPLRQGYLAMMKGAGGAASGLWEVMVWPHYRDKIKDRYPFNMAAKRDASYEDMVAFFKPNEGVLWGFYDGYLAGMHRRQNHDYIPLAHLQGRAKGKPFTPFNPLMYNCLKRADEITDALWPGRTGEEPNVVFLINLKTVSPVVSDVIFEVDGQTRKYRNEKEYWYQFKWPGTDARGARIQVRGAGGLDEEIRRDGPWGIFRLFESADEITAVKGSDQEFLVTWQMTAPPVSVTMQVRPRRGNHPFPLSFFRGMNCPPSIGDKFGGGKDKG